LDRYLTELPHRTEKTPEEPYHSEDGDNIGSQPDDMPDNQSGTLCAGSEVSRFKNVASDKEGINKSNSLIAWRIW